MFRCVLPDRCFYKPHLPYRNYYTDLHHHAFPNAHLLLSPGWLLYAPAPQPIYARLNRQFPDFNAAFR